MVDNRGMLRHLAFFEELAKLDEKDSSWRSVKAGLVVMRLVDQWIEEGPGSLRPDARSVAAVREAIADVADTTPLRRILCAIVDTVVECDAIDPHALTPRLMAYGQALEYEARWALATDVYRSVVAHSDVAEADLVIPAYIRLGFCYHTLGDLESATASYNLASEIALASNDLIGILRARLGEARIATTRGNMPRAEAILDEAIAQAAESGLDEVRSRALTDRAWVAGLRGQYDRAVRYSYQALELSKSPRERDRILGNIASGMRDLGLLDTARDAYLVLAATGQEQYLRWWAEVNLMELAAHQRAELQFDKYRRDLESADFTPELRVTYFLHVGRGYHSLGHSEAAVPYLERAIEMAAGQQLNQLLFEAESALADARRGTRARSEPAPAYVDSGIQAVIDGLQRMKLAAGIA